MGFSGVFFGSNWEIIVVCYDFDYQYKVNVDEDVWYDVCKE